MKLDLAAMDAAGSFTSSKTICAALMAPTLKAAKTPDMSPFEPMRISVSVTPCCERPWSTGRRPAP
jgi:hypothetical protein